MKAVQTRCPQRALQVLSEHRDASTSRSKARCEARRKARQFWWLGGGERMAAAQSRPVGRVHGFLALVRLAKACSTPCSGTGSQQLKR